MRNLSSYSFSSSLLVLHTCRAVFVCLSYFLVTCSGAANINVNVWGNNRATLTCSATGNVLNMQWRIMYSETIIDIGYQMINRSVSQEEVVTESITLSSQLSMSLVQSTLNIDSSGGELVPVTFICSGRTELDGDFSEMNTVSLLLPTTTTPTTNPPPSSPPGSPPPTTNPPPPKPPRPKPRPPPTSSGPVTTSEETSSNSIAPTTEGNNNNSTGSQLNLIITLVTVAGVLLIIVCLLFISISICVIVCYKTKKRRKKTEENTTAQEDHVYDYIPSYNTVSSIHQPTIEGKPTQWRGGMVSENHYRHNSDRNNVEYIAMTDNALYNAPVALPSVIQQVTDTDVDHYYI